MKNQLMKLRKSEGFISIETIMVAAIIVVAGLVAYNVLYVGTLAGKTDAVRVTLEASTPDVHEVFDMGIIEP